MKSLQAFYERVTQTSQSAERIRVQLAQLEAIDRPPERPLLVLDVGCGDGYLAALAAGAPGVRLIAVDLAHEALVLTRRRGLVVGRASVDDGGLPFKSEVFDVVMMSEIIEHLVDPDLALSEARRVLIPGGTLLLSTPNLAAWFNRVLLVAGVQPIFSEVSQLGVFGRPGKEVVGHLRLFTSRALLQVLDLHGFHQVTLAGAGFHEVPRGARWLDRGLARRPSLAAILVAAARRSPRVGPLGRPAERPEPGGGESSAVVADNAISSSSPCDGMAGAAGAPMRTDA